MFQRTNTVNKAIAPLLKALNDLKRVKTERMDLIKANENKIVQLEKDSFAADVEKERAEAIIEALSAIVNPKKVGA